MYIEKKLHSEIEKKFIENIVLFETDLDEAKNKIEKIEDIDIKLSLMFLYGHLPLSDLAQENIYEILLKITKDTFYAKNNTPWGDKIPVDVFLAHVLFPRVSSEILESNRETFFNLLINRVKEKSMYDAVVEVNYFSYEQATYRATDRRTAPPSTLLKSSYGRCGEEAVFTVTALRSLSIPARQVYTPVWAHTDNNHAWVEAWVDGEWFYLGACEPEQMLDRGWFTSAASRAMLLESRSFYQSDELNSSKEEYIKNGLSYNINLTKNYADTKKLELRVVDNNKNPIKGIKISFNIINHGALVPLIQIETNENGEVSVSLGLGSVYLNLSKDNRYMQRLINLNDTEKLELIFSPSEFKEEVLEFNTFAPRDPGNKVKKLSKETEEDHKTNAKRALELREKKERVSLTTIEELKGNTGLVEEKTLKDILFKAKGNGKTIVRFLEKNNTKYGGIILRTLNEKDYTDFNEEVLSAHLNHAIRFEKSMDEDVFIQGVLPPRIYFEAITDYRSYIDSFFNENQKEAFIKSPKTIWDYLNKNTKYIEEKEYSNINISIEGALKTGYANEISKKILFVAICRTLGVPARITHDTVDIEYYFENKFTSVIATEIRDCSLKIKFQEGINWAYGTNWSISRQEKGEFIPLMLRNTEIVDDTLTLKNGNYMLLTTNRLPNGDVYVRRYNIILSKNESKEIEISLRKIEIESMLNHVEIGDFSVFENDKEVNLSSCLSGYQNVLIWLEENHEPSQHILNELLENKNAFKKGEYNLVFLIKDKKIKENLLIKTVVDALNVKVYCDKDFKNQESVARRTYVNPEELPLIILTKRGLNSIFALSGYRVGSADMVLKILGS